MNDAYQGMGADLLSPASHLAAITPSDTAALPTSSKGICVGGSGNVAVVMVGGESVTFANAAQGKVLPVRAQQVKNTGTTATNLPALY